MIRRVLLLLKKLAIAGVILVFCGIAALYFFFPDGSGKVILQNQTSETIDRASIAVARHTFGFGPLEPGENMAIEFQAKGESHYEVSATFRSGRQLKADLGYVGSGFVSEDTLIVNSDGIVLGPSQKKSARETDPLPSAAP